MTIFYSKRNSVELINGKVVKTFFSESDFRKEFSIYQKLSKSNSIMIPKIESADEEKYIITIEYLEGPTVLEYLETLESNFQINEAVQVLLSIIAWLDLFYKTFEDDNWIMGDVNLRNFIWFDNKVYGIDFESSCTGDITSEKAELLARYMLYSPSESDFKTEVLYQVLESLKIQEDFLSMINNKIETIRIRREKLCQQQ